MRIAVLGSSGTQAASAQAVADALQQSGRDARVFVLGDGLMADLAAYRPSIVFNAVEGDPAGAQAAWAAVRLLDAECIGSPEHACRLANDGRLLNGVMDACRNAYGADLTASWLRGICISQEAFESWGLKDDLSRIAESAFGFPLCVKPAVGGSAVRADDADELEAALRSVFALGCEAVVRQWVEGVELRACILGSGWDAYALPLVEVSCTGDGACFTAPVSLDSLSASESDAQAIVFELERAALEAYQAFGMRDYGVVEMAWDGGQARILGVQTNPSMVEGREFQAACQAARLSIPAVLDALVGQYE